MPSHSIFWDPRSRSRSRSGIEDPDVFAVTWHFLGSQIEIEDPDRGSGPGLGSGTFFTFLVTVGGGKPFVDGDDGSSMWVGW